MVLSELLGFELRFRHALALGFLVALIAALVTTPRAIRKLRSAGITGKDINKPDRPMVPEMGGLAVFLAFNIGAFALLGFGDVIEQSEPLVLAGLVVAAGAAMTGVLDDLVELRQRFKALIPFAFAAPLSLYLGDPTIEFPFVGPVDFGLAYPLVLLPLGIACATNGFNMLEGFNGLGAGLGIIMALGLSVIAFLEGNITGLALLMPLLGALIGFLYYNQFPARVFPGDTMTLLVGAVLAAGAILSKIEFWGALLFLPHIVEFFLKARGRFEHENFASRVDQGYLHHEGRTHSLMHMLMRWRPLTEPRLVAVAWLGQGLLTVAVVLAYLRWGTPV